MIMTKIYRSLLIVIVIGLLAIIYAPLASAAPEDEPTGLSGVTIWVYPEYDQPSLLTMFRGQLTGVTASAADPATVRFLMPATAVPFSAGFIGTDGLYARGGFTDPTKDANIDPYPDREASEIAGWDEITFTVDSNSYVFEYYDPVIPVTADKLINYEFPIRYPIADLTVYILQPRASSNFSVSPPGTTVSHNAFGENYPAQYYSYSDLTVDDDSPLAFDISYTKSDARPSTQIPAGGSSGSSSEAIGIVSIVMAVIVVASVMIIIFRQKSRTKRRPAKKSRTKIKRQKFCRQCGKQLDRATPHCPYCGAKQK
jgi:hypothetical protein